MKPVDFGEVSKRHNHQTYVQFTEQREVDRYIACNATHNCSYLVCWSFTISLFNLLCHVAYTRED